MKKALRIAGLVFGLAFIAAQFFRPIPNNGVAEGPQSLVAKEKVPPAVRAVLQRACYDCHSNQTKYPWYASVQPLAWWLDQHVVHGKTELNLSEWGAYDTKRAVRKLQAISDEVIDKHMPLPSYLWAHPEAKLTEADVTLLADWAEELGDELGSR